MRNTKQEPIERVTIKLPRSIAAYFRSAFPHGKRSDFVVDSILRYKHEKEVAKMEETLRIVTQKRQ